MATKYWALDYVDEETCELVVDNQLYKTEEEAIAALHKQSHPEHYEVNWYTIRDLEDSIFYDYVSIDDKMQVCLGR